MIYVTPNVPNITIKRLNNYKIDYVQKIDMVTLDYDDTLLLVTVQVQSDELDKLEIGMNLETVKLEFDKRNIENNNIGMKDVELMDMFFIQKIENIEIGCCFSHTYVFYNGARRNIDDKIFSIINNYELTNKLETAIDQTNKVLRLLNNFNNSDVVKDCFEKQLNTWNEMLEDINKK